MRAVFLVTLAGLAVLIAPRVADACSCGGLPPVITPADGRTDVPLNAAIFVEVSFDDTAFSNEPVLTDSTGGIVLLAAAEELASGLSAYRPISPLVPDADYLITLSNEFMTTSRFHTGTVSDDEPPTFAGVIELTAEAVEFPDNPTCFNSCIDYSDLFRRVRITNPLPSAGVSAIVATFTFPDGTLPETRLPLRVTIDHLIQDAACVSTVPPPFSADQEVCVTLTTFDEAGHPSPPLSACSIVASCGGFDPDTCGPTDECLPIAKGCGCSTTRGTATPFLLLLLAPLVWLRRVAKGNVRSAT